MKILIAVPDTGVGGVTSSAVNFSNELASRGHSVHFLDMSGENACKDRLHTEVELLSLKGKSRLWNIGVSSVKKAHGAPKLGLLALGLIKKLTIRSGLWFRLIFSKFNECENYDVAVAFRQCAPCYSFVLNKVGAKKKIGFVHGDVRCMGNISSWKKYMTRFDKIAYVSNAVKDGFVAAYPALEKNASTIYNMFDVEKIKELSAEPAPIEFDKTIKNIVTVSRIEDSQKRTLWIPHVAKALKEKGVADFKWYVVGMGPDFHTNVKLTRDLGVDDVVSYIGSLDNPFPLVKSADFSVLPSQWEAYGMVVVESMILGKPVVVTGYPAIYEIMEHGKQGLIAEMDVNSLAEQVYAMLQNSNGIREACANFLKSQKINNDTAYKQFINTIR